MMVRTPGFASLYLAGPYESTIPWNVPVKTFVRKYVGIFVVLAASFQRMRALDVTLPEARTGAAVEAPAVVEVMVAG